MLKLIFSFVIIWLVILRWVRRRKIQCCKQFKNDIPSLPLIGHAYMMMGNKEAKMKALQTLGREAIKQGGVTIMQSWVFDYFYAMVADADVAEIILRNCLEKDDTMKMFQSIFGRGLLVCPVPEWRCRRKVLNPVFTSKSLNQNVDIFQKNSAFLAKKLQKEANNGSFSIYDHIAAYSLDSVLESIFGVDIGAQKNPQHPVMRAHSICCELISNRICLPWLHNQTAYEMTSQFTSMKTNAAVLFDFLDETIVKKCKDIPTTTSSEPDYDLLQTNQKQFKSKTVLESIVEHFNKNNDTLSDTYLREETFIITFAGTDTTSVAISFVMVMLSRHPDIQEKVYQEAINVLGDSKKPIDADDLLNLKYTEAVIKETLRMYPPAPALLRKIDKDITLPSGKTLLAGTGAMINVWAVHHNPLYWEDPEQFRPERFLESAPKPHAAAFLPFSYGVRNCIGYKYAIMSMKTTVSSLIRQYRVLPANDDPKAVHPPLRVQFDVMIRDVDNFRVQIVKR